jgi:hypothetical protein
LSLSIVTCITERPGYSVLSYDPKGFLPSSKQETTMTTITREIDELSVVEMDEVTGGCIFGDLLTLGGLNDLRKAIDNQPSLPHGNPNGSSPTQSTGVNRG